MQNILREVLKNSSISLVKFWNFYQKKPIQSIRLFVKIFPSETFMLSWSLWKVGAAVGGQLLYLLVRLILNPFYEAAVIILRKKYWKMFNI